jgi:ribosome-associated protein
LRTKTKAVKIARIAYDKKAEDILILDVRKVCNFTDYFVLVTGQTSIHLRAICDEVNEKLKTAGVPLFGMDGLTGSSWRVMDYGDVVFHCFSEETRRYFDLERLWGDAKTVEWSKK